MLILSRNPGESIRMFTSDGPIDLTFPHVRGNKISIAINAPRAVKILRSEVIDRVATRVDRLSLDGREPTLLAFQSVPEPELFPVA